MATLLPNGKQTFIDANGAPLAGGSVTFYIAGTSTPKSTFQNAAGSILNTNPVILDAAGSAVIYGTGTYRQVVTDANGNLVWDQITGDTAAVSASWGGTSTGSANAQTVSAANFTSQDGQSISFVAGFSNTAAATLAAGGATIPMVRDTSSGPQNLTAGDIIAGNVVTVVYSATQGTFHLRSPTNFSSINATGSATFGGTVSVVGVLSTTTDAAIGRNLTVVGTLAVNGAATIGGLLSAVGAFSTTNLTATGTGVFGGAIRTGGAALDTVYAAAGVIVLPYGLGVRATNTVTARGTVGAGYFNSPFGFSAVANPSAGVYSLTFTQACQNALYQVAATAAMSSGAVLLIPVVSNKTTAGFTLSFYSASTNALTSIGAGQADIIVSGGN